MATVVLYYMLIKYCSCIIAIAAAKSLQLWLTLCDPIDGSPSGSPVPGILQARTLEWVAISFSNEWKWKVKVTLLSRVWLSNPVDCSLPGSSIHGVFQARVLEWGAIAFSDYHSYRVLKQCYYNSKKNWTGLTLSKEYCKIDNTECLYMYKI